MAPQIIYNKPQIFTSTFPPQTQSIDFNGTDEFLRNATDTAVGFGDVFSFVTWIKLTADPASPSFAFILRDEAQSTNDRMELTSILAADTPTFTFWDSGGTVVKNYRWADNNFSTDVWIMLAFTYDGTTLKGYFDGIEDTNPTIINDNSGNRSANPSLTVTFGATDVDSAHLAHRLLYAAFWDTELSQAEVTALFNSGTGGSFDLANDSGDYASSANLQHWWRCGHDASDIGKDSGSAAVLIDIDTNAQNITSDDIVEDAP